MNKISSKGSLFIKIDPNLYLQFKVHCAQTELKMVTVLRPVVEKEIKRILKPRP